MYVVSTRAKGTRGSLTLPERGYRTEPSNEILSKLESDARQQYHEIHGVSTLNVTVDMKVEQRRGSQTVSRDGQIVPKK